MRLGIAVILMALETTPVAVMAQGAISAPTAPAAPPAPAGDTLPGGDTAAPAVGQAQQDFTLVNNTGHTVAHLNVSPSDANHWGPDILGGDKLGNGESAQIKFARGETQCNFDIKVTYDDGDITDLRKVNLCEVATVTLTPN